MSDDRLYVVDTRTGRRGTIAADDRAALEAGRLRLATPEERQAILRTQTFGDQGGRAAAQGFVEGATLGLVSDESEPGTAIREENPGAFGLGRMGGSIGVGLAAAPLTAGALANAGLAGRVGILGAEGAVMGGIDGAAMAAREQFRNGQEVTAEAVLAGAGGGAFFGFGAGAGFGALGSVPGAFLRRRAHGRAGIAENGARLSREDVATIIEEQIGAPAQGPIVNALHNVLEQSLRLGINDDSAAFVRRVVADPQLQELVSKGPSRYREGIASTTESFNEFQGVVREITEQARGRLKLEQVRGRIGEVDGDRLAVIADEGQGVMATVRRYARELQGSRRVEPTDGDMAAYQREVQQLTAEHGRAVEAWETAGREAGDDVARAAFEMGQGGDLVRLSDLRQRLGGSWDDAKQRLLELHEEGRISLIREDNLGRMTDDVRAASIDVGPEARQLMRWNREAPAPEPAAPRGPRPELRLPEPPTAQMTGTVAGTEFGPLGARVERAVDEYLGQFNDAVRNGDAPEAFIALDQAKRRLWAEAKSIEKHKVFAAQHEPLFEQAERLARYLERQDLFGEVGRDQKLINAAWSPQIRTSIQFGRRFNRSTGEIDPNHPFRDIYEADSERVASYLRSTGSAESASADKLVDRYISKSRKLLETIEERYDLSPDLSAKAQESIARTRGLQDELDALRQDLRVINQYDEVMHDSEGNPLANAMGAFIGGSFGGGPGAFIGGSLSAAFTRPKYIIRTATQVRRLVDRVRNRGQRAVTAAVDDLEKGTVRARPPRPTGERGQFKRFVDETIRAEDARTRVLRQVVSGYDATYFADAVVAVEHAVENPDATHERMGEMVAPVSALAEGLDAQIMITGLRALRFLDSKIPPRARKSYDPVTGNVRPMRASRFEVRTFNAYAQAIDDPLSIFDWLADGSLRDEHVEAVQAVFPQIYNAMVAQVLQELQGRESIPYRSRVRLSRILGTGIEPTLQPRFVETMMSARAAFDEAQSAEPTVTPGNATPPNLSGPAMTEAQRLQGA